MGCKVQSHASMVLPTADPQAAGPSPAHHGAHIRQAALVLLFPFSPQMPQGDFAYCFYC